MKEKITRHTELEVYRLCFNTAMKIFELSKTFPREETYSLTDQVRRSSRSVCANLAEAWRKRRYEAHFISKISDAEAEAAETQVWIEFAVACGDLPRDTAADLFKAYEKALRTMVGMITHSETWVIAQKSPKA